MSTIILKKSSVAGKVPVVGDLAFGELALNYTDGKLYYKTAGNLIDYIANGGTFTTALSITSSTQSTSTTTGAFVVTGGVGIGGNIAIGGALYAGGTTGTNGQVLISTGNGISWTSLSSSFNGGTITSPLIINNSTGASSTTTGALQITNGGIGVGGSIFVGGVVTATTFIGNLTGTATTATDITGGTLGQIPYQSAPGVTRFINTGVNGALLQMGAAGTATFVSNSFITVENSRYLLYNSGQGAIPYSGNGVNAPNAWLPLGTNGYILVVDTSGDGQPAWANPSTLTVGLATSATNANNVTTVARTTNADHFLTFVDSNNATATAESVYTTSSFTINPASGGVRIGGVTTVTDTTQATSTITGAFVVTGGVGIGGNIAIGGALYAGGTTGTNGQILTSTGNGISWTTLSSSFNGGTITSPLIINNSTGASSTTTGALQITNGGVGIGGGLFVGGTITATQITVNGFPVSTGTSGGSVFTVQEFTATAGQTTFTVSAGYTVGQIQVFANGINLTSSEYTASDGSTVVLGNARVAGDIIRVMSLLTAVSGTANNLASGTAGQLVYQSAPGVTSFAGPGTSGQVLVSAGTSQPAYQSTLTLTADSTFNSVRIGRGSGSVVSNTVLGNGALDTNTTGTNNIAIGYLSLNSNQIGANNVALGYETMFGTTNAFADTALGARALQNISSGQYNIGIGYNAGNSITTGTSNTIIGSVSGTAGMTGTVIIAAGTTERIRVDSSNLYINGSIFTGGSSVFTFGGTGTPATGTALTPYLRVMTAGTSVASSLVAKTAPSGSSFVVSILRSSNNGSTFPDTITTLTLTSGNQVTTASPTTSLAVGDLLRLDISSVNGASDWTAQLKVT